MWLTTDEFNFVPALAPAFYDSTITTNFPCKVVNMAKYGSMVAVVSLNNPSTCAIWVQNYASLTPSGAGAGGAVLGVGNYRISTSTATLVDTLGSRVALATTAIAVTADTTSGMLNYYIEIKSDDLAAATPYVAVSISTSATASTGMAVNYIMKPRYPDFNQVTAIS